jgi:hypothetical protein
MTRAAAHAPSSSRALHHLHRTETRKPTRRSAWGLSSGSSNARCSLSSLLSRPRRLQNRISRRVEISPHCCDQHWFRRSYRSPNGSQPIPNAQILYRRLSRLLIDALQSRCRCQPLNVSVSRGLESLPPSARVSSSLLAISNRDPVVPSSARAHCMPLFVCPLPGPRALLAWREGTHALVIPYSTPPTAARTRYFCPWLASRVVARTWPAFCPFRRQCHRPDPAAAPVTPWRPEFEGARRARYRTCPCPCQCRLRCDRARRAPVGRRSISPALPRTSV